MSVIYDAGTDDATRAGYPMPTGSGTVAMWVKPTWPQTDAADHSLIAIDDGSGAHFYQWDKFTDNALYCGWFDTVEERVIVASAGYTLVQNQWNTIIHDYDTVVGSHLYVNGTLVGSRLGAMTTPDLSAQTLHVGNSRAPGTNSALSQLWRPTVFARVLSAADRALYIAGGQPATSFSNWPFETNVLDATAAARHLTPVNLTFGTSPALSIGAGGPLDALGMCLEA